MQYRKIQSNEMKLLSKVYFRLLPVQILLSLVGAVNGIVNGLFAGNILGEQAMSAIGLFGPVNLFFGAVSIVLMGGAQLLCGEYMGKNRQDRMQSVFSVSILITVFIAVVMTILLGFAAAADLTVVFTRDTQLRRLLNLYILGQAIGFIPMLLNLLISAYLSLENQTTRTTAGSVVLIFVNIIFDYLFVAVFRMGIFGLALASALGQWVFFVVQIQYYFTGKSNFRLTFRSFSVQDMRDILVLGYPGALARGYQTIRGLILNALILSFVGSTGLSAMTALESLLGLFWAIPAGMLTVSRILMGISIGEEDRKSLTDIMRIAFYKCFWLMGIVSVFIALMAVPFTRLFYRDSTEAVYQMTVTGFRVIPFCMPFTIICTHFVCYGQALGKQVLVHVLSILDGVVCVAGFTALLIPFMKMNSFYAANILNGVICAAVVVIYSFAVRKKIPRNMEELMVIPDDFGVADEDRIDISVRDISHVVTVSGQVVDFCRSKGIDERRSYFSGLFLEEMAGNVVSHGFKKDKKSHSVDIRVVHKDEDVILRIKDDCIPFDPAERRDLVDPVDEVKNMGIRMVYKTAKNVSYQNILGLNVLTIRI